MNHRLFSKHFQVAYIVNDIDQAMGRFRDLFGIMRWNLMNVAGPESPAIALATAYVDELMVELIQPSALPSIYHNWVPSEGPGMRFHHLGFLVHSDAEWDAALGRLADSGFAQAYSGSAGDLLDFHYTDCTAEFGHYYELIHLKPGGVALFDAVPRN